MIDTFRKCILRYRYMFSPIERYWTYLAYISVILLKVSIDRRGLIVKLVCNMLECIEELDFI